ncbi:hypothetical protein HJ010_00480 [Vibrio parahaemolyticus]|nr:hypothetical protein [Vibrio parahaemolyticus]HCM1323111.1 hypothetical protein [Vibrio parahaemolyticus]HCM1328045.1 hypothetical protein [Vibrio parahaemolyticus]
MNDLIEKIRLQQDINNFYTDYCDVLCESQIENWPSYFTNDALYRITTKEAIEEKYLINIVFCDGKKMIKDRAIGIQKAVFFRRQIERKVIGNIRIIETENMQINVSTSFFIVKSIEGYPPSLLCSGISKDIIAMDKNQLRFKQRLCILDADVLPDSLVYPI